MKKLALTFALLASFAVFAEPLNAPDRNRILNELQASRKQFLDFSGFHHWVITRSVDL